MQRFAEGKRASMVKSKADTDVAIERMETGIKTAAREKCCCRKDWGRYRHEKRRSKWNGSQR